MNKLVLFLYINFLLLFVFLLPPNRAVAQSGLCTPNVPFYTVNLVGNPGGVWTSSPPIVRRGDCCNSEWPDRCIEFAITLDQFAVAINFEIASGAIPPGAMFYQIGCGPPTQVGEPICIDGPGPHALTFCKPGSNLNTYRITSIPGPSAPPPAVTSQGCNIVLTASGLDPATVRWRDITSGTGAYNSYLSCQSGCISTTVTPAVGAPAYVDYEVYGVPLGLTCLPNPTFTGIVRVTINPLLVNTIGPSAAFCESSPGVLLNGNITGGAPPYTYIWKDAIGTVVSTDVSYFATATGTYTQEVRDGNYPNCPAKKNTVSVTKSLIPTVNAGNDVTVCPTNAIVKLAGSVTGVTTGTWSGGAGVYSPNNTTLNATYTPTQAEMDSKSVILTLTTTGGVCPPVSDNMIIRITDPLIVNMDAPPVVCFGKTVSLTANVTGGSLPYTYLWSNGQGAPTISNQTAGNYSVKVTDGTGNACVVTSSVSLPQNPQLVVKAVANSVPTCDTKATVSVSSYGGSGAYTYLWNTSETSTSISVNSGKYIVTGSDASGCTSQDSVTVQAANTSLNASIAQPSNICYGATKQVTVLAKDGNGGFTYLWTTGATSSSITAVAGNYCVNVKDAGGCEVTACVAIVQDPILTVAIPTPAIICNGATASLTANPTGGTGPYTYSWSSGQNTQTNTQPAGTYTVTVTDANSNSCKVTSSVTISQAPVLNTTLSSTNVSCFGGNNGSSTASTSGGTVPYSYYWSPSGGTGATASGLYAGTYTVTVTDGIGCIKTATAVLTQPVLLSSQLTSSGNVSCKGGNDGTATVVTSGGTSGYSYVWSPLGRTGETATELSAGTYTVKVTDSKGCEAIVSSVVITEPPLLVATINSSAIVNVSCYGASTGRATVTVTGGTSGYSYSWSPSGGTSATATGLAAGVYTVSVTDAKGCNTTATAVITQAPALVASIANTTNVSCFGGSDGTATVSSLGGTAPYTYLWSPSGGTLGTESGLAAGSYTVKVTDSKGCIASKGTTISQNPILSIIASPDQSVLCDEKVTLTSLASGGDGSYSYAWSNGSSASSSGLVNIGTYYVIVTDGKECSAKDSVTVSASNSSLSVSITAPAHICQGTSVAISANISPGVSPYSYLWDSGETTNSISAAGGGHCVKVTDNAGCIFSACANIIEDPLLEIRLSDDTICKGSTTTITPLISGGLKPYTYSWTTGELTPTITKPVGTYSVTVEDKIGCRTTQSAVIREATDIVLSAANILPVSCFSGNDGSITVNATGGNSQGYIYLWSPTGATTQNVYGLTAGMYTVTATSSRGCKKSNTFEITQPASALTLSKSFTDVTCFGKNDGYASVSATGGTPSYSYLWQTGDTLSSVSNLKPGNYTISVSDANGCFSSLDITITEPLLLTAMTSGTNVSCKGGNDGKASVAANGGTKNYTYAWSPSGGTAASASGLSAGTYSVIVKDAKGCTQTLNTIITEPDLLSASIEPENIKHASCFNSNDGNLTVTSTGGTIPYSYSWSPSGGATQSAIGLLAGTYIVSITDAKGCTTTATAAITQPAELKASIPLTNINNVSCFNSSNDGSATVAVTGGTVDYKYLWTPKGGAGSTASGLSAGAYTVTVTDSMKCKASASVIIIQPPLLTASVFLNTVKHVSCFGGNDGRAVVTPAGGTPDYTYSWAPGGGTDATATGLSSGTYTVTVKDAKGCLATATIPITEPLKLQPSFSAADIIHVTCKGAKNGSAKVTVAGGTPNYAYSWSPSGGTSGTAIGLSGGTYTVTVKDSKGCEALATAIVPEPDSLKGFIVPNGNSNFDCNGVNRGTTTVSVTGGTPVYTYLWSPTGNKDSSVVGLPAGTHSVSIADAKGCKTKADVVITPPVLLQASISASGTTNVSCYGGNNGSTSAIVSGGSPGYSYSWSPSGGNSAVASGLQAGNYTVSVSDAKGCNVKATVNITQPTVLLGSISNGNYVTNCYGGKDGSASISASGGTAPYSYSWSPSGGTSSSAIGLSAGKYKCVVTDARGCSIADSVEITQPPVLTVQITIGTGQVNCFDGSNGTAVVSASGGTLPYTYFWSPKGGTDATATNLTAGNYSARVTDAKGCIETDYVTITKPEVLTATILNGNNKNVSCYGGNDGSATVTVTGGSPSYSYSWSPSGGAGPTAINISAGNYTVSVADSRGCKTSASVSILQPPMLAVTIPAANTSNVKCFGGSDGSATVAVTGGTPAYSYSWSPKGGVTGSAIGLTAGIYSVTVSDNMGCQASANVNISQPNALIAKIDRANSNNVSCYDGNDGNTLVSVSGGAIPYSYAWSPNISEGSFATDLVAGNYSIKITDQKGCTATDSINITEPAPILTNVTTTPANCTNDNGSASVSVSGGSPGYTYIWSNNETTSSLTNIIAGIYDVTIIDSLGCIATDVASVPSILTTLSVFSSFQNESCSGKGDGSISVTVSKGTPPYSYTWQNATTTSKAITNLTAGIYNLTVQDINGCSVGRSFVISAPPPLFISIAGTDISCKGKNDGTAFASVQGGSAPYNYSWTPYGGAGAKATILTRGTYLVTVRDAKGCTETESVNINEPEELKAVISESKNVCYGGNDGSATVTPSGGTINYSYSWFPGNSTTRTATNLSSGTYTVTVKDSRGCPASTNVIITQPPVLKGKIISQKDVTCYGGSNGAAEVAASGGTPVYAYEWLPKGGTGPSALDLKSGKYVVKITDNNGCEAKDSVLIFEPPALSTNVEKQGKICSGGSVEIGPAAAGNYTYEWSPADGLNDAFVAKPTVSLENTSSISTTKNYFLTTTFNGCFTRDTITVTVYPKLIPEAGPNVIICSGESVTLTATGGTGFLWNDGTAIAKNTVAPATSTVYLVNVFNQGCAGSDSVRVTVIQKDKPTMYIPNTFTPNGDRTNEIFMVKSEGISEFKGMIFNRWGELYFEWNDINEGWDGRYKGEIVQEDVYVYKITSKTHCKDNSENLMGTVNVLR